ncbi:MAG: hypothetical protein HY472_01615 [Candidatus Sungbacteria bacterium]|nr:hypothetical protein [Candidatus Sungbacteria bacterium]
MAKSKMTIDKLAGMTQRGFIDVEERLSKKMDKGFSEMRTVVGAVLKIAENIEGRVDDVHSLRYVDIPELRSKIDALEERTEKLEGVRKG